MTIKLIMFDLSNVCFNSEDPIYQKIFRERHNLPEKFSDDYYEILERAEVGEMSVEDVWSEVLEKYEIKADPKKLIQEVISVKEAYPEMLNFIKELKKKYKTAYLTNYGEEYWKIIEKNFDFSAFDYGLVSYKIKSRKPSAKGFQLILKHFKVKPEESVFTDDAEKNLVNAKIKKPPPFHFPSLFTCSC